MPSKDQKAKEDVRLSGEARSPKDKVPTYQEALDEALENTFPASDPVAASAAAQPREPHATPRDDSDWALEPGAGDPVKAAASDAPAASTREPQSDEARRLRQQSRDALDNVREGHERAIDDSPARPSPDRVRAPGKGSAGRSKSR
ncbi:MAG TPA: hypothetical protein VLG41_00170 [Hydrogenophaga sp.]|uniref:hypothetical protein n=1 Tax=Hydrogenophaga sp. TaxID=1904254 RepID=UPI002C71BE2E|nr:hypothetical protein [Hydrogenophaga sp.]HSX91302.1 hypothetical protein [Hydrogenophaga sp.]